ncbi:MAG: hypothetical protein HY245_10880 [Rhizobiales bacterium]|nr:hypothetical protein [Hyphomicrobiales bacterium]MBI3673901.1 hypothetical protein [Hyphomicrobiales bacterium]
MHRLSILAAFLALMVTQADAATTKKTPSRADYTGAQQKKIYEQAVKACRKSFGDHLHFVRVDYKKRQYVCYAY